MNGWAAPIPGIVLAGGLSRRMGGGDKALRPLQGRPLLSHAIKRLSSQAAPLAINANGDPSRFAEFGLPTVPDATTDFAGPLAGILAGIHWASSVVPEACFLATVPCDCPFFPDDMVARLRGAAKKSGGLAIARSSGRLHPVFGLWPLSLAGEIEAALAAGARKVAAFVEGRPHQTVEFQPLYISGMPIDPFFNANTPGDLAEAEALLDAMERP